MKQMSNVTKVLKISFHNNMNHESAFRLIFPSQYSGHMVGCSAGLLGWWDWPQVSHQPAAIRPEQSRGTASQSVRIIISTLLIEH